MNRLVAALSFALSALYGLAASAHEVRPAYLEIVQQGPLTYAITWKQPAMGDVALHLVPHLSNRWLEHQPQDQYASGEFVIRVWRIQAKTATALEGQTVFIEGLKNSITDAFVRIRLADGRQFNTILRPDHPAFRISFANGSAMGPIAFLRLGVEHILSGPDHLLFVLGLILIVRDRWTLLKTVSAFTLAHSLTLAAATFGLIDLPASLLNALIALSILFLAPEVLRFQRGETSLAIRYPWIVAFGFGLLHGMGFASGLTSLGLDKSELLTALVLFNIGVEIGQLLFIALIYVLKRAFRMMEFRCPQAALSAPSYVIGTLGAFWTIQCSAIFFGVLS